MSPGLDVVVSTFRGCKVSRCNSPLSFAIKGMIGQSWTDLASVFSAQQQGHQSGEALEIGLVWRELFAWVFVPFLVASYFGCEAGS